MANFLIVSCLAETVGVAIRLRAEGHNVRYYVHTKDEADCGDGFIEKVGNWREHIEWADLVFFDDVRQRHEGDTVYDAGKWFLEVKESYPDKPVIGGHPDTARLENDRMYGQQVLQECGVPVVEMVRFTSFDEARAFVEKSGKGYAVKHNGQVDRNLSGVFFSPEETIEFLDWLSEVWDALGGGNPVDFVLQEAVKGVELAVTCFFNGERFLSKTCYVNQEVKKELNGDLGPNTGQMGEVGIAVANSRLFVETLAKTESWLRERGYCSWIDLNCIVSENRVVPLEFTARPGYPTVYTFCELVDGPIGEFLLAAASKKDDAIGLKRAVGANVVFVGGTYPDKDEVQNRLAVVYGLEKVGLRNVWLSEARWEDGKVRGAGVLGYLGVVTGSGPTIDAAVAKCYSVLRQLKVVPFIKYRTDIGEKAKRDFPKALEWGWLL